MSDLALFIPILLPLLGALLAALYGLPGVNRRLSLRGVCWALAVLPLISFLFLLGRVADVNAAGPQTFRVAWIPSLGVNFSLWLDSLSLLFLLLVSGIGALVVVYSGYYFSAGSEWRFLTYLFLFMTAMSGILLAGDVVTLFLFWEGTSVTSFLLIAYKTSDAAARRGAFKSLFITGGGGVAMLAGLLFTASVAGGLDFATILASGDVLRSSPIYPVMLALVAFGAFTKSAQAPAHIWLPDGMSAPTPASAYLHSATMVKAGIYLMARMNPALGQTELWFWLLTGFGLFTMMLGAFVGLKQRDLKALLAYSTISQLGVMMMLIGDDTSAAFKALVVSVVAHALYKSALFLVVGIIDHETGTRNVYRLGGLRASMPRTMVVATVAALSMAGLPPMFGFLAKETLLASVTHPSMPPVLGSILVGGVLFAAAFLFAQAGTLIWDTFMGKPRDPEVHGHEPPVWMLLMPAVPALLSLTLGLLPEPKALAEFISRAAEAAYGGQVKVSLALWAGITPPLVLSIIAIAGGFVIWLNRGRVIAWQGGFADRFSANRLYDGTLSLLDRTAGLALRTQDGHLRHYLATILIGAGALIVLLGEIPQTASALTFGPPAELPLLRVFALALAAASAAASIILRRDFFAILALSTSGLSIALLMLLQPAPDVALVQVVVDLLSVVVLTLALTIIPREQLMRATLLTYRQSRPELFRDIAIAVGAGFVMTSVSLFSLTSRPRASVVTPYYEAGAKPLTGAADIVGAIVVDFRGFDTLVEITVFAMAGIGMYTLIRYAMHHDAASFATTVRAQLRKGVAQPDAAPAHTVFGIDGMPTSSLIHLLAYVLLPVMMVLGATQVMYGHDQPGDGFTAGVIISLAIAFWYVVFGYQETRRKLRWLKSSLLVGLGLLLQTVNASLTALFTGSFFSHVDYGALVGLPLPKGFNFSSSFIFELAICITVLGGATLILGALGHPTDPPVEG